MKIGISTINDYNNYGNRLQNYALQEFLKNQGYEVITIKNNESVVRINNSQKHRLKDIFNILNLSNGRFNRAISRKKFKIKYKDILSQSLEQRKANFYDFTKRYIKETPYTIDENNIPEDIAEEFDYFMTGSDQVWNPNFRHGSPIDFLMFAPQDKRISYAASFGVSEIPQEFNEFYTQYLNEMNAISVREDSGVNIVKILTGREAIVLADPTLLISVDSWRQVSFSSEFKPKDKYLLTYFLEEIPVEAQKMINKIVNEKGLEVVNLGDQRYFDYFKTGPSEFIDFIDSCDIFFTNSFHACVFSIIFHKPFVVFKRGDMNSRIDTLLGKFDMDSRKAENIHSVAEAYHLDFTEVQMMLDTEKIQSQRFINKVIGKSVFHS